MQKVVSEVWEAEGLNDQYLSKTEKLNELGTTAKQH